MFEECSRKAFNKFSFLYFQKRFFISLSKVAFEEILPAELTFSGLIELQNKNAK